MARPLLSFGPREKPRSQCLPSPNEGRTTSCRECRFFPLVREKSHVPNACRAQMRGAPPLVENPCPRTTEPWNPTFRKLRNVVHPAVARGSAGVSPAFDRGFRARTRCRQDAGASVGPRLASTERTRTWGTVGPCLIYKSDCYQHGWSGLGAPPLTFWL